MRIYKPLLFIILLVAPIIIYSCSKDDEEKVAPSNLNYSPSFMSVGANMSSQSVAPSVDGTAPFTFTLSTTPDAGGEITINSSTGVVSVSGNTNAGTYTVSVTASNSAGSTTNSSALSIEVEEGQPVTFDADINPMIVGFCAPCHTNGGSETNYTVYANAKASITSILDRIQRVEGSPGFMPNMGSSIGQDNIDIFKQWESDGLLEN